MSPGEAAMAEFILTMLMVLGTAAAIGALIAIPLLIWLRARDIASEWEWPHGY